MTKFDVLKQYWGYDSFRFPQAEVIDSVLSGKDTIALAATSTGKTVMFQIPALLLDGVSIVISPLKSLQKDQVDRCTSLGIPVALINSDTGKRARKKIMDGLTNKTLKILYVSPETLLADSFKEIRDLLTNVPLFAIDEAHCCSSWGDFRPKYRLLMEARENYFPDAVVLAVTATADDQILSDIKTYIGINTDHNLFKTSFDRPSIEYKIIKTHDKSSLKDIVQLLRHKHAGQAGIIYCNTQKKTMELAAALNMLGFNARHFHAKIKKSEKDKIQEDFLSGEVDIICATTAFGMGIDKPDVRWVIHEDPPNSFDDYSQQVGRASRDGLPSIAYMFYKHAAYGSAQWLLRKTTLDPHRLIIKFKKLKEFHDFCLEDDKCRRKELLAYFGEKYPKANCGSCDVCKAK